MTTDHSVDGPASASSWRRALARKRVKAGILLVVGLLIYAAVAGWQHKHDRYEHTNGAGPLQSHTAAGVTSMFAPKHTPWYGTFGSYLLCSTTGAPITIENIRYNTPVKPLKVSLKLRTVPAAIRKTNPAITFLGGSLGQAPALPDGRLPGQYKAAGAGTRITQKCADQDKDGAGFTELLFVMKLGKRGGLIDRAWIDYRADGRPYTLRIEWQMAACGVNFPRIDGDEVCDGTA